MGGSIAHMTFVILALLLAGRPSPQSCPAPPDTPRLDHVILVVRDLHAATAAFRAHGFRIKPGRPHPNGLLNNHVKFRDGSEIELMTVRGTPGDAMARGYAEMLAAGEGGVYLALRTDRPEAVRRAAAHAGLALRDRPYGAGRFLSFPSSPAAALFLTSGFAPVIDGAAVVAHDRDVTGLNEVWIEGGPALERLLEALGARACGSAPRSDGVPGRRWALSHGTIVVVEPAPGRRPRVIGAALGLAGPGAPAKIYPHPTFWVRFQ